MTKRNPNAWRPTPIEIGSVFGRLTVIAPSETARGGQKRWLCRCSCGVEKIAAAERLRKGSCRSCGCLVREATGNRFRSHGGKGTVEYTAWNAMVQRCCRESHPAYKNYGGRGITVCAEWRYDFAAFLAHIGPRPSPAHSLDRINNDHGYEPGNVRWATSSEQAKNRRDRARDDGGRYL